MSKRASKSSNVPAVATHKGKGKTFPAKGDNVANQNVAIDIPAMIERLKIANESGDRKLGKQLRRKLRAGGHRGGLRGGTIESSPV